MASALHEYGIPANAYVGDERVALVGQMLSQELDMAVDSVDERWRLRKLGSAYQAFGRYLERMAKDDKTREAASDALKATKERVIGGAS